MHLADGVLNTPAVIATSAVAGALVVNAVRTLDNEDIPKVSLMTATFFVFALMSFPVGPSSVHPLLGGLIGIVLGWQAPLAVCIGLVLQAAIFQHGGFTTLGINTIMVSVPAIIAHIFFKSAMKKKMKLRLAGALAAVISICLTVVILLTVLSLTSPTFKEIGFILALGHLPLAAAEGVITAVALEFLSKTKPEMLSQYNID